MNQPLRILILGGYGTFGGRLAQLLSHDARVSLLLAGRSLAKAKQYCAGLHGAAERIPLQFDRDANLVEQINQCKPDILVDASGPFQAYGTAPYRVVEACLACQVHYLDLADGSAFVQGIEAFDEEARAAGIFVLSGVSSYPVLTAAVVRALLPGMAVVRNITGGIAPSPYAGVGLNVIRAIASYAGKPVSIRRDSQTRQSFPFTETIQFVIAPPGKLPLHALKFSLVDVPDLQILPTIWPHLQNVWMGAGPVPGLLHAALRALAWMVRLGLLKSLAPMARLMHNAVNWLSWGEHRGGMFVSVTGEDAIGQPISRSWHLLAEGDDGPLIPSMAAAAIVQRVLSGASPTAGARAGVNDLELSDYEQLFQQRTIYTGLRVPDRIAASATLYQRILGSAWNELPEAVREMHELHGSKSASGLAQIKRGQNWLAVLVAKLFRFPPAGTDVPVNVRFQEKAGQQFWQRTFATYNFSSKQFAGAGRYDRLLCERFGPFVFGLALVLEAEQLQLVIRRWNFLGLPLPLKLAPHNQSWESIEQGRFNFNVSISLPLAGLVVRYKGWLVPDS